MGDSFPFLEAQVPSSCGLVVSESGNYSPSLWPARSPWLSCSSWDIVITFFSRWHVTHPFMNLSSDFPLTRFVCFHLLYFPPFTPGCPPVPNLSLPHISHYHQGSFLTFGSSPWILAHSKYCKNHLHLFKNLLNIFPSWGSPFIGCSPNLPSAQMV